MEHFFAPCPRGLEAILAQELTALGATAVKTTDSGAHFAGPLPLCYRANLESRIASRILWRVAVGPYRSEDDIYRTTLALTWPLWFEASNTLRVNVSALRCPLKSLDSSRCASRTRSAMRSALIAASARASTPGRRTFEFTLSSRPTS